MRLDIRWRHPGHRVSRVPRAIRVPSPVMPQNCVKLVKSPLQTARQRVTIVLQGPTVRRQYSKERALWDRLASATPFHVHRVTLDGIAQTLQKIRNVNVRLVTLVLVVRCLHVQSARLVENVQRLTVR